MASEQCYWLDASIASIGRRLAADYLLGARESAGRFSLAWHVRHEGASAEDYNVLHAIPSAAKTLGYI
jgi:hypothetical protein